MYQFYIVMDIYEFELNIFLVESGSFKWNCLVLFTFFFLAVLIFLGHPSSSKVGEETDGNSLDTEKRPTTDIRLPSKGKQYS